MNKNKCIDYYNRIFKYTEFSKVVPFRSPSEGNNFKLERSDYENEGIIWGNRKQDKSKYIRYAKVYFSSFVFSLSIICSIQIGLYIDNLISFFSDIGLYSMFTSFILIALYYYILVIFDNKRRYCIL